MFSPLAAVEECVKITGTEMEDVRRRNMMNIRDSVVPYQNLREVFNIDSAPSDTERIVVVSSGEQRVGFGVDSVVGQHQTVIKSLGRMYQDIKGISGATILGGRQRRLDPGCGAARERRGRAPLKSFDYTALPEYREKGQPIYIERA